MSQEKVTASLLVVGALLARPSSVESAHEKLPHPEVIGAGQSPAHKIGVLGIQVEGDDWKKKSMHVPPPFRHAASKGIVHLEKALRGPQLFQITTLGSYAVPRGELGRDTQGCIKDPGTLIGEARKELGQEAVGKLLAVQLHGASLCGAVARAAIENNGFVMINTSAHTFAHEAGHTRFGLAHQFAALPRTPISGNTKALEFKLSDLSLESCGDNLMGAYCKAKNETAKDAISLADPQPLTTYNLMQAGVLPRNMITRLNGVGTRTISLRSAYETFDAPSSGYSLIQVKLPWAAKEPPSYYPEYPLKVKDTGFAYIDVSKSPTGITGISVQLGGNAMPGLAEYAYQIRNQRHDDGLLQPGESIKIAHMDHSLTVTSVPAQKKQQRVVVNIQ